MKIIEHTNFYTAKSRSAGPNKLLESLTATLLFLLPVLFLFLLSAK